MLERALDMAPQLTLWRREFHRHPELGFQETRTAARVSEELQRLGYRVRTGVGRTGVVAERGNGHPTIAVRADMDALPIKEANDVSYASSVSGVMHACGHDAHVAIALGVATLLASELFPGTVRFLYQPSEEMEDDQGISGARRMIEDHVMDGVDAILALHVDESLVTGDVAIGSGASSAGVDTFHATIIGRGGHGASPHETVDPFHIAGHIILALNSIVARRLDPTSPAVISIGSIHGGHIDNVIPEQVKIVGTIRYDDPETQRQIHLETERVLQIARALGGDYSLTIAVGYPPAVNDPEVAGAVKRVAIALLGEEHVQPPVPSMGAEDFGFFTSLAPGAMFGLGCRLEDERRRAHSPRFDIDESCLPVGVGILAQVALDLLRHETP